MNAVDVSVFMTVKNGEKFIQRSVNSILKQTLPPREIVIVDDGSVDNTCRIVKDIALDSDVRIELIQTSGVGRAKALNLAVNNCTSEWVANLDVDDYWMLNKLEKQVELIKKQPTARAVTTGTEIVIEAEVKIFEAAELSIVDGFLDYKILDEKDFYLGNPINHSSIIFTKEIFNFAGSYNESLNKQIDIDLWVRFLLNSVCFYQVNCPLTVKYLHSNQSFEANNVLNYRFSALKTKLRYLRKLEAPSKYFFMSFLYFGAQFLPRRLKGFIKSSIK